MENRERIPSMPSSIVACAYNPTSLRCGSFEFGVSGHLIVCVTISTNPARRNAPSIVPSSTTFIGLEGPEFALPGTLFLFSYRLAPSSNNGPQAASADPSPSQTLPSSLRMRRAGSRVSTQPVPGRTARKASAYTASQFRTAPQRYRMCTKSKEAGWKVHGVRLKSSISKRRLPGTQDGWVGDMSVPITSQCGKASAKSLDGWG